MLSNKCRIFLAEVKRETSHNCGSSAISRLPEFFYSYIFPPNLYAAAIMNLKRNKSISQADFFILKINHFFAIKPSSYLIIYNVY